MKNFLNQIMNHTIWICFDGLIKVKIVKRNEENAATVNVWSTSGGGGGAGEGEKFFKVKW